MDHPTPMDAPERLKNLEAKMVRLEKDVGSKRRVTLNDILTKLEHLMYILERNFNAEDKIY